eukprot:scaffold45531_cov63-Phaeocystis_antarctica.AAC.8
MWGRSRTQFVLKYYTTFGKNTHTQNSLTSGKKNVGGYEPAPTAAVESRGEKSEASCTSPRLLLLLLLSLTNGGCRPWARPSHGLVDETRGTAGQLVHVCGPLHLAHSRDFLGGFPILGKGRSHDARRRRAVGPHVAAGPPELGTDLVDEAVHGRARLGLGRVGPGEGACRAV